MGAGFTVNNPNAVAACGCGSSFRTADDAGIAQGLLALIDSLFRNRLTPPGRPAAFSIPHRLWPAPMKLPLFPLHAVLCPGIALPLHIFEDRYRALVRHCIDSSMPFGIVLIRDGREVGGGSLSFSAIGTLAEIRQAGRYPDGRYDLLVVGTGRFAIEDVTVGEELYLIADATVLDDEVGDAEEAQELANRATRRFVRYLELLQPQDGETAEELDIRVEVETEDAMPPGRRGGRNRTDR